MFVARESADDISQFYGRVSEQQIVTQCAKIDRCRTIGMFGLGGIGKTALSIKLAHTLAPDFEIVIWRSLCQGPTLDSLLQGILPILNDGQAADISIEYLIDRLQQRRCLIFLDNIESILEGGDRSGAYLPGYDNYGRLLESVGDLAHQIAQGHTVFGSLWQLLDQQFDRLSPLQQQIMYWLAIVRAGITPVQLQAKLSPPVPLRQILADLLVLRDRSAIESTASGLTQQPVVMEYTIERFISQIEREIIAGEFDLFDTHAAIEAKAPEYVRDTQIQLILHPIAQQLLAHFGGVENTVQHLKKLINRLRDRSISKSPKSPTSPRIRGFKIEANN